ncbi:uncharacterized protein LOC126668170 [Mercurialis annua]|uniref:uncharacterized protein LOC126668170 n=1 Tax=Mercurialis annua TaxID=3986 RepID=UPI00215E0047|nr:uncharacterized protein LOC126668170 [Mercurialis annua]
MKLCHVSQQISNTKSLPRNHQPLGNVVYFEDYPDHWFYSDLQRAFEKFGVFGKVIITRRRNRSNKRFGFLHIDGKSSIMETVNRLNTVNIGSHKIRAFVSKFPKPFFPGASSRADTNRHVHVPKPIPSAIDSIRDSRSYANVVLNKPIHYNTPVVTDEVFSLIASVKRLSDVLSVDSFLLSQGINFTSSSLLGGSFVLLNFENPVHLDSFRLKSSILFPEFFDKLLPWDKTFVAKERFAWVTFRGIPLQAWNDDFFMIMGNQFGKAVYPLNLKERMDVGSVLISTSLSSIDCTLLVFINGKEFFIQAKETDMPMIFSNNQMESSSVHNSSESEPDISASHRKLTAESAEKLTTQPHLKSAPSSPVFILHKSKDTQQSYSHMDNIQNQVDITSPPPVLVDNAVLSKDLLTHSSSRDPEEINHIVNTGSLISAEQDTKTTNTISDGVIRGCNRLINGANLAERFDSEAKKTWAAGLELGLFDPQNEEQIVSLFSQGGLSYSRKQRFIRALVSKNNLSIMGLLETKKEFFDEFNIRRLWPDMDFDFCYSPSRGASGGILCIWNKKLLSPANIFISDRWLYMDFAWGSLNVRIFLVYASNCPRQRLLLWNDILPHTATDRLCIMAGDFNEILDPSERVNCEGFSNSMREYADFVARSNLIETALHGRYFTWNNSISRSKIDRCFISSNAFISWPNLFLKALPKTFSDHVPLLFSSEVAMDWGPKPFKSINAWCEHSEFYSFIELSWCDLFANPQNSLVFKLKELRKRIRSWNKSVFGDLNLKSSNIQRDIEALEITADSRVLLEDETIRLSSLHAEFNSVSSHLESLWLQKSRMNWNLFGDRNSKYFHSAIKQNVHLFYKKLFKKKYSPPHYLDCLPIKKLSNVHSSSLTAIFTEEEVYSALSSCDSNKAPGPDGFNFFFYKKAWNILMEDIIKFFHNFHQKGDFPTGLNTAFMVLLPKFAGASDVSDFRPISLINGILKLLSKVLAIRLAPVLPNIISENQFGDAENKHS